jgi:mRNA interferase MazF
MTNFSRGDVVAVDFGMQAKVRPAVVVSVAKADSQRNMSVVVPMTTEIRNGECEVSFPKPPWLKQISVVNLIGVAGVDNNKIERRLGRFDPGKFAEIEKGLARLLGLK